MLIIFDLDDTLVDTFGCSQPVKFKVALNEMIKAGLNVDSKGEAYKLLMEINETSAHGKETVRLFLDKVPNGQKFFDIGVEAYYGGEQLDFPVHALDGAHEVLEELSKNHDLVIVSFGVKEEQYGKMGKANINPEIFKKIITMTDAYDKTKHYKLVSEEFSCTPEKILVIGDKFSTDLLPASKLGMKTVHIKWGRGKVNLPKEGEVDYSITNLRELLNIVKELEEE